MDNSVIGYSSTAAHITNACVTLRNYWQPRVQKFRDWYTLLRLEDELETEGTETYVSNNPRTFYNMAVQYLMPVDPAIRIDIGSVDKESLPEIGELERRLSREWKRLNRLNVARGRGSWLREFIGLLVTTGWVSVFCMVDDFGRLKAEVWHPGQVFPGFNYSADDETRALTKCAHVYDVDASVAKSEAARFGLDKTYPGRVTVYDYWDMYGDKVRNAVVIGTDLAKPLTDEPMRGIPIIVFPVGGLPDRGVIATDTTTWKSEQGQSALASAEPTYKAYNKLMSFTMHIVRTIAQSRWYERTKGERRILTPELLRAWGPVFRLGPDDDIGPLPTPQAPPELRALAMDVQSEVQRGSLPWATFGNIQQQMSAALFGHITSAAGQVLGPFHEAVQIVLSRINNTWLDNQSHGLPEHARFTGEYEMNLPRNLVQEATVARMLNPDADGYMSQTNIMDKLFRIRDPLKEQAVIAGEKALRHPMVETVNLLIAVRQQAATYRNAGDERAAQEFDKLANQISNQLDQMSAAGLMGMGAPRRAVSPSPEALGRGGLGGMI